MGWRMRLDADLRWYRSFEGSYHRVAIRRPDGEPWKPGWDDITFDLGKDETEELTVWIRIGPAEAEVLLRRALHAEGGNTRPWRSPESGNTGEVG